MGRGGVGERKPLRPDRAWSSGGEPPASLGIGGEGKRGAVPIGSSRLEVVHEAFGTGKCSVAPHAIGQEAGGQGGHIGSHRSNPPGPVDPVAMPEVGGYLLDNVLHDSMPYSSKSQNNPPRVN